MLQVVKPKGACNRIFKCVPESTITCSRIEMHTQCNSSNMLPLAFNLINVNL